MDDIPRSFTIEFLPDGSLEFEIESLRRRAEAIGFFAISAGLDQLEASMRDKRDAVLNEGWPHD